MKLNYAEEIARNSDFVKELTQDIINLKYAYQNRVFDKDWSKTIKHVLNLYFKELEQEIDSMQKTLGQVKAQRKELDDAYFRQTGKNPGNVAESW